MANEVPEPDRLEKGLRLGCGGLLGVIVGVGIAVLVVRFMDLNDLSPSSVVWGIVAASVVVCAILSLRFGDRFWGFWSGKGGWRVWMWGDWRLPRIQARRWSRVDRRR